MLRTDSNVKLIREFFGNVRPVTMDEMKALTIQDRDELGSLIKATLPETVTA